MRPLPSAALSTRLMARTETCKGGGSRAVECALRTDRSRHVLPFARPSMPSVRPALHAVTEPDGKGRRHGAWSSRPYNSTQTMNMHNMSTCTCTTCTFTCACTCTCAVLTMNTCRGWRATTRVRDLALDVGQVCVFGSSQPAARRRGRPCGRRRGGAAQRASIAGSRARNRHAM